ncbi:MAG: serine hydrolase [Bacteriovoracales bacterium]|nr:serine hydrolase [Bacteriovoracales bacterium]
MDDKRVEKITSLISKGLPFDSLAVGIIDFSKGTHSGIEFEKGQRRDGFRFFDLSSLTKPLTLSLSYLKNPDIFDGPMKLLLDHRGGLPAWGRLSEKNWRQEILKWKIKKSPTLYSDYGALRLMLEWEKKTGGSLSESLREDLYPKVVHWKDLKDPEKSPPTGKREGREIRGRPHDPNAHIIGGFCSHAGLFGPLPGVCDALLEMNTAYGVMEKVRKALEEGHEERFVFGFDRMEDPKVSLAGPGCSPFTFGHLGFTGTSFWIDPVRERGCLILSNATQNYWHEKGEINRLRREIGAMVWSGHLFN